MDVPPKFDISRLDIWKVLMSCYLKALGLHVYLAITKESYPKDSKHIEANAIALKALEHLFIKIVYMCFLTMSPLLQYGAF